MKMYIDRALVIDEPWISLILEGKKTWEMRSSACHVYAWAGLIKKGTGKISGIAKFDGSESSLSLEQMLATFDKHQIPESVFSAYGYNWFTPWKIEHVIPLKSPIAYVHKSGAVTWVRLDDPRISDEITRQLGAPIERVETPVSVRPLPKIDPVPITVRQPEPVIELAVVPFINAIPSNIGNSAGRHLGEIEITQGNLDNNHIYIMRLKEKIPKDVFGGSKKSEIAKNLMTIDYGNGLLSKTDIPAARSFFRDRSTVGKFFKMNKVKAGDIVTVEETAPYNYSVRLKRT